MRWRWLLILFGALGPDGSERAQDPNVSPDAAEPVLRIDGQPISGDEYGLWLMRTQGEKLAREFAHRHWVVDREAKRLGVDVPEKEVARDVERVFRERIAGAFLGSRESWHEELARTGRSEDGLRQQRLVDTRAELQTRNIAALDRVVPELLIRREWELRHGRKGRRYDLQMIKFKAVVPSVPGATHDEWKAGRQKVIDEAEAKARAVRQRALAGEEFGLLATQFSDDPDTRDHRGTPSGGFTHVGWPASFLDALEKLSPGEILEPRYANGGVWIVKLRSVHATPLESVREAIEADLVARGPEPYEIGMAQQRLAEGVQVRALPSLYSEPPPGEFPSAWEPALLIDGEPVKRGDYARWLLHTQGEILAPQFVEERVVLRKARSVGVDVDEVEVLARCRERIQEMIDSGYHGNREVWLAYLALVGRSEESFLRDLSWRTRINLLAEKVLLRERKVTPEEVRERWKEVYGAGGRRVDASVIVIRIQAPLPPPDLSREELSKLMDEASAAARIKAEDVTRRLRAGEDFAELARRQSDDPKTKDKGGALPERFRPDAWSEEIAAAVTFLQPGQWTEPILWGQTWVILKVTSVRKVAFEEVEREIEEELRTRRPLDGDVWLYRNVLIKEAKFEVLPAMVR